ncbi:hypothetical protein SDC9_189430 [bioreactor metagenome]|uniref:Uncharacterized protein n=1 Tax=bioreactor metagenome TaxID=1076179 RepID=A0A645HS51_9ZZZZ
MNGNASAARDVANDWIAGQRVAAVTKAHRHAGITLDDNSVDRHMRFARVLRATSADFFRNLGGLIVFLFQFQQLMQHLAC